MRKQRIQSLAAGLTILILLSGCGSVSVSESSAEAAFPAANTSEPITITDTVFPTAATTCLPIETTAAPDPKTTEPDPETVQPIEETTYRAAVTSEPQQPEMSRPSGPAPTEPKPTDPAPRSRSRLNPPRHSPSQRSLLQQSRSFRKQRMCIAGEAGNSLWLPPAVNRAKKPAAVRAVMRRKLDPLLQPALITGKRQHLPAHKAAKRFAPYVVPRKQLPLLVTIGSITKKQVTGRRS